MKTIFKALVGSRSYGTNTETSDHDYKGVYMQDENDLVSFKYKEQYEVGKDEVYYEVRRFLQLLQSANPTMLELLWSPDDCIIEITPEFEYIRAHRHMFLTKKCLHSFGGYAIAQIKKAKGLDKKMNWEKDRVERKGPMDFAYIYEDGKTVPLTKFLKRQEMKQEYCGLVALEHFRDAYALYYDWPTHYGATGRKNYEPLGYHGIVREDSNELCLSSVPKGQRSEGVIYYNKDGYSMHCKDYREYEQWLSERNTQRYVDLQGHNQKIDGKNLLHCRRLLNMAMEIPTKKELLVRRPDAAELLKIRRGEVNLDDIIKQAEEDILKMNDLYANSDLPEEVDFEKLNQLLLNVRHLRDGGNN